MQTFPSFLSVAWYYGSWSPIAISCVYVIFAMGVLLKATDLEVTYVFSLFNVEAIIDMAIDPTTTVQTIVNIPPIQLDWNAD